MDDCGEEVKNLDIFLFLEELACCHSGHFSSSLMRSLFILGMQWHCWSWWLFQCCGHTIYQSWPLLLQWLIFLLECSEDVPRSKFPLRTLPIRLIGQNCATKNFLSTPCQPCGGNAVEGSIRLIFLASVSRSIKEFRSSGFLSPGESALRNTWAFKRVKDRTNCSLGLLWIGQEVFCLKLM